MKTHYLKTWPDVFAAVARGDKTAEFRRNDRDYAVGDVLVLREYDPQLFEQAIADGCTEIEAADFACTGREVRRRVTHLVAGGQFGIPDGYVMLSIVPADEEDAKVRRLERRVAELERDAQALETERLRGRYCGLLTDLGAAIQAAETVKYNGFGANGRPVPEEPDNSDAGRLARVLAHLHAARRRALEEE